MSQKTTLKILITLAFIACGFIFGIISSKQIQTPQAKEVISKETNVPTSSVIAAKGMSLGIIIIVSGIVGFGISQILTKKYERKNSSKMV